VTELEKIDLIRERMGVSYAKAKEALDAAGGDVVQALINLEASERVRRETFQVSGSELVEKVRHLLHESTVRKVVVKTGDRTLFEIPVAVGAIGALVLPTLAALGVVAAMVTQASIIVERRDDGPGGDAGGGSGAPGGDGTGAGPAQG